MDYPKWKYSLDAAVIVQNEDEEKSLDGVWVDSPELVGAEPIEAPAKHSRKPKAE